MKSDLHVGDHAYYWAFISYGHEDDRVHAWGRTLHRALEKFPVAACVHPNGKLGKSSDHQRHFRYVFLDRAELGTGPDLSDQIRHALQRSAHLIVVCSPAAGRSTWINKEVCDFNGRNPEAAICAYLVDGPADAPDTFPTQNLPPKLLEMCGLGEPGEPSRLRECHGSPRTIKMCELGERLEPSRRVVVLLDARSDARDRRWLRRNLMHRWPLTRYWLSAPHIVALCGAAAILLQVEYATVYRGYRCWRIRRLMFALGLLFFSVVLPFLLLEHGRRVTLAQQAREQYRTGIAKVEKAWESGQAHFARELLLSTGTSPYCGAEWRYLQHQQTLCRYVITGHSRLTVDRINYSPDGERLLTRGGDHSAKVWESRSGKMLVVLEPTSGYLIDASFLSNDQVVTVNERGYVESWEIPGGIRIDASDSGILDVVCLASSLDGETLALGDKAGRLWLMKTAHGAARLMSSTHKGPITDLAFSEGASLLATAGEDGVVEIWQTTSRALLQSVTHRSPVNAVKISSDGLRLLTSSNDGNARIWNLSRSRDPEEIALGGPAAPAIALSPLGNWAITGDVRGAVRVWNSENGLPLPTLRGHAGRVTAVACAPDGRSIASGDSRGELRVWSLAPDHLPNATPETSLTVSADNMMYFFGNSGEVRGLPSHELLMKVPPVTRPKRRGAFSPDRRNLLVTDEDAHVTAWNLSTGKAEREIALPGERHVQAEYLPDGRAFVTCTRHSVDLRNAADLSIIRSLTAGEGLDGVMAVAPDGRRVAVARGEVVEEIAVVTGAVEVRRRLPAGTMIGLAYSSGSTRLAATAIAPSGVTVAYLFYGDEETPAHKISQTGHNLMAASFLDNGARVITSWNRTLTIWEGETGDILLQMPLEDQRGEDPATADLQQLVVSRDGSRIFVTGRNCQQWYIPPAAPDTPHGCLKP